MATKEWIESLAQNIKDKNREPAEEFGRAQHQADIITTQGRTFFGDLLRAIEDNFTQIRRQLQGDPTSAEIAILTTGATQAQLTRSRFPWFDAQLAWHESTITLDYAKDPGIVNDPKVLDRKNLIFNFKVDPADVLYVEDAFGDTPAKYATAEDLAQRITQTLFEI
jgi:hypothetical protein